MDGFGSYETDKQLYPVSHNRWDSSTPYQTQRGVVKDVVCHSIFDIAVIKQFSYLQ